MKELIISMSILFLVKVLDNVLGTMKTIFIQRNRIFLSTILVIITNIIFYKLIDAAGDGELAIYVISIASGVGTFLALFLSNKFSKDRLFVNVTTDAYTKDFKKTLAITVYAETKAQSKLIDDYLKKQDVKFKRIVSKQ